MRRLFVGIDVSKDFFVAVGLDPKGNELFRISCSMDAQGFIELLQLIMAHCKRIEEVVVAMESTGCYHINLFSHLTSQGIETVVINPLLISNFAKLSLRKTKTDKKDALTIARFLLVHKDSISQLVITQDIQDLRDVARERESLCSMITAVKADIKRVLRATFPELEAIADIHTQVMLHFLQEFPSARLIKKAKPQVVTKALQRFYVGGTLTYSADDIIGAAQNSVAVVSPAKEAILQGKISTLLHLLDRLKKTTRLLTDLCESIMLEDLQILISIKGVNSKTAGPFLAEIGAIGKYESYKKLIAYAGLDPSLHQSGKWVGKSKISKRGNRHLRRVIYLMAACVVRVNAPFKAYFLKRKGEGLPPQKALFATAHKLIRVIFAMLSQRTYFRAEEVS
jgi:transposase